ncbi:MAG: DNA/RNA non-specific endonuclease [Ferruginibacter sp.]
MKRNQYIVLLISLSLFIVSCKKESPAPVNPQPVDPTAKFTVVSSGGACSNTTITGSYMAGTVLDGSNKVIVQVNVTATGTYTAASSNLYGMKFSAAGSFTTTGSQTITLTGTGTPAFAGTISIPFTAGYSTCSLTIFVSPPPIGTLLDNDHMLMGNPSNGAMIIDSINNYLMRKPYYTISYSRDRGTPNWVSWHLYNQDLGSTPRQDDFRPDYTLPPFWYEVPEYAYSSSGFDRGHNCPSGDRTNTVEANSSTFFMTNMIPQAPTLNQQTWGHFEDSLRRLVNAGFELYIIMGTYGTGGTGNNGFATTIDGGQVAVPASIWKIAVVIPNGNNDISRVDASIRLIAVDMPNTNSVNNNWKNYRVSVDAIEAATGYDLLSVLPAPVQAILEARVDNL